MDLDIIYNNISISLLPFIGFVLTAYLQYAAEQIRSHVISCKLSHLHLPLELSDI